MSDPFAAYGHRATTTVPDKLLGPNKTRAEARQRYVALVASLQAVETKDQLDAVLKTARRDVTQFHAELDFMWEGDGDFLGLRKEIEWAQARVDDRLDMPRWEPGTHADMSSAN